MSNSKTNLQELNYRFIKVLLNDTANKVWLTGHYDKMQMINDSESDFNYDAWCKGLFRGDNHSMLLCYLESIYLEKGIEFNNESFNEPYKKGSLIDLINIETFVSDVLYLWYQLWEQDFSHELIELRRSLYYEKCKDYSFTQFSQNECGAGYDIGDILSDLMEDQIKELMNDYKLLKKGNPKYTSDEIKALNDVVQKGYADKSILELIN